MSKDPAGGATATPACPWASTLALGPCPRATHPQGARDPIWLTPGPLSKDLLGVAPAPLACPWARTLVLAPLPANLAKQHKMSSVEVLWGRPCLMLEPARAFAFGQGVRAPTLGGVRPWYRLPERVARERSLPQHRTCSVGRGAGCAKQNKRGESERSERRTTTHQRTTRGAQHGKPQTHGLSSKRQYKREGLRATARPSF